MTARESITVIESVPVLLEDVKVKMAQGLLTGQDLAPRG